MIYQIVSSLELAQSQHIFCDSFTKNATHVAINLLHTHTDLSVAKLPEWKTTPSLTSGVRNGFNMLNTMLNTLKTSQFTK